VGAGVVVTALQRFHFVAVMGKYRGKTRMYDKGDFNECCDSFVFGTPAG
jgi:hypothetical protein